MNSLEVPPRPWSERAVDGVCLVFASWTVACHAALLAGGSLWLAATAFAVLTPLAALGLARLAPTRGTEAPRSGGEPGPVRAPALRLAILGLALVLAWAFGDRPLLLWWAGVGLLAVGALLCLRSGAAGAPARGSGREPALWALALGCALLALVAHRSDLDDSFYLNLAVSMAEQPGVPLFSGDTLHGVAGLPLHHAAYRLHSWEAWNALVARLLGLPVIATFHWVSAALAAALVPLAWARLFRRLAPAHWLVCVFVLVFALAMLGDTHRLYGNFAFVRIWQGKSVVISVLLPWIASAALDFVARPSLRRGVLLAAGQIAALGLSASAVWLGPAVALATAASGVAPDRDGLRRLALAALASLYVLGIGSDLRVALHEDREARRTGTGTAAWQDVGDAQLALRERRHVAGLQLAESLDVVLGDGPLRPLLLGAVLGAWAVAPTGVAARFACIVPLGVLLVLLNPYASDLVTRNVVGNAHWRTLWALPVPALLCLVLTSPLALLRRRLPAAATSLLLVALFAGSVRVGTLSAANDTRLAAPSLKVPIEAYRIAEIFDEAMPAGARVVAPREVAAWLPTFADRTYPLMVRPAYLRRFRLELGESDLLHRVAMTEFVEGRSARPDGLELFARGLRRYEVDGVLMTVNPATARARAVLREAGFEKRLATLTYEIWARG